MLHPQLLEVEYEGELHKVPHWVVERAEDEWELYESFPRFLERVWQHLGLPAPTQAQYEIAHRLQYGYDSVEDLILDEVVKQTLYSKPREDIIRAFRGLGKSYITMAFVAWRVMRNPRDEKVLVVSATTSKAKEFVAQLKGIMHSMPELKWLLEGSRELDAQRRDTAEEFDVSGASLSQSYSVAARGITGQITGSRATLLVADDMEIEKNSKTEEARSRILNSVRSDFVPITKTEHGKGDIICLGTPQTEESVYNVMVVEMGFRCFTIPVRFPQKDKLQNYVMLTEGRVEVDILAPYLRKANDEGKLGYGSPTDTRFDDAELIEVEAKGKSAFALQYMLDTSLSDAERYPLKLYDLIVMSTNGDRAPRTVSWGLDSDRKNMVKDIPNLGFSGDHLLRPLFIDKEWVEYDQKILYVDPAGRGKDETAWTVLGQLNGLIYVIDIQGEVGDPTTAMSRIALDCKKHNVREVLVEPNYGQGMWVAAFQPILERVYPGRCTVEESEWAKGQKETRIIDTLEPVMTSHRLVVNESVLKTDSKSDDRVYSFMYQLTHITRDRGCLSHDDRLDTVAGGVAHFLRSISMDVDKAKDDQIEVEKEQMIEAFEAAMEGGSLFAGREMVFDQDELLAGQSWRGFFG